MATRVNGYSAWQIGLHWVIAILVLSQIVFAESMGRAFGAFQRGRTVSAQDQFLSGTHYWFGLALLALVGARIVLRVRNGAPPAAGKGLADRLAQVVHGLFYVLLVLVPVSGLVAYYGIADVGDLHELSKPVFIVLVAIHVAAALWHQFVVRDGVLRRMMKPGA